MKELLEKLLHIEVMEKPDSKAGELPYYLRSLYDINYVNLGEKSVYLLSPKGTITLPNLKKHLAKFQQLLNEDCVLCGNQYPRYGISKLIEMGVPFIFGENQIYLPNFGIRIHEKPKTILPDIECFSSFTQKLVLCAFYEGWQCVSGKELSEMFGVSRMTVNRSFIELEALGLPFISMQGKSKYFTNNLSREDFLKSVEQYLVSPVRKTVRLRRIPEGILIKGGRSALAEYSMISDNAYPTYALGPEQYRNLSLDKADIASKEEAPECLIQIHRYLIEQNGVIDPVSATLSVSTADRYDDRIDLAIEETRQGVFNGKWIRKV